MSQDDKTKLLAANIQWRIEQLDGITNYKVLKELGLGESFIRDLSRGKSHNPRIDKLEKIADYFKCTIEALYLPVDELQKKSYGMQDKGRGYEDPADKIISKSTDAVPSMGWDVDPSQAAAEAHKKITQIASSLTPEAREYFRLLIPAITATLNKICEEETHASSARKKSKP